MTQKRRNHGRNKCNRGHTVPVRCVNCVARVPKDKAIQKYVVKNIVDASALTDLKEASVYEEYALPKIYVKEYYCISCAVHAKLVRVRSKEDRKIRESPEEIRERSRMERKQGMEKEKVGFN